MIAQDALDLVRGVLFEVLVIAGPVMLIAMVVGLLLGVLQTAMQIQDTTVFAHDGQSLGDAAGFHGSFDSGSRDDRIGGFGIGWGVDFGCNDCARSAIFPWGISDGGQHAR